MTTTRQDCEIFLIGQCNVAAMITMRQLPTIREVLQRFHHHLKELKSVRNASHATVDEILEVWTKAFIPTTLKRNVIDKLEEWHSRWLLLNKNKGRVSEAQKEREKQYAKQLDVVFDISHTNALSLIKIQQDKNFLMDQRNQRKMYISDEDKELTKKKERVRQRLASEEQRRVKGLAASASTSTAAGVDFSICYESYDDIELAGLGSDNSSNSDGSSSNFEQGRRNLNEFNETKKTRKRIKSKELFTKHLTSALDRNKTSDR